MLLFHRLWQLLLVGLFISFLSSCGAKKKTALYGRSDRGSTAIGETKSKNKGNLTAYYADILGVDSRELNRDLYAYIDSWMGIPHRMGGMTKKGVDCSGFVNMLFSEIYHKELPRTSRDMAQIVKRKHDNQLKEGDLVFFSFGGRQIDHVGIYLHNDRFVHVSTKKGVMISNLKEAWYYKYLERCGTPKI